ncbi:MAG: site-2 protease family protein [Vicinamibacterales bacterium]
MTDAHLGVLFISFLVLLFSLTVHEAAHALAADRLGDPTARLLGRISLNPLVHIDPIGTVVLPLLAIATNAPIIGWAKPVPVNGLRLKHYRRDFMAIAAAGPASNLVIALAATVVLRVVPVSALASPGGASSIVEPLTYLLVTGVQLNVLLAVFNMLPIPPLDGGNVVAGLLPPELARGFERVRPYGVFVLYALMFSGALSLFIQPPYRLLLRFLLS